MAEGKCLRCGDCCKRMRLELGLKGRVGDLVGAHYDRPAERLVIRLKHRCKQLDENDLCKIYDSPDRPQICQEFLCRAAESGEAPRLVINLEDD